MKKMKNLLNDEQSSLKKIENSINELKGNLFEFLVGQCLAQQFSIESDYLHSLPEGFRQRLVSYEYHLRKQDPQLIKILPQLAKEISQVLLKQLPWRPERILLIGKISGTLPLPEDFPWAEADLLLYSQNQYLPLSLKLCKGNSYVNTKNAGVQSFLSTYFSPFESCKDQEDLALFLEESYLRLGHELYQKNDWEFPGHFDSRWKEGNLSELPGELPLPLKQLVYQYYSQVITFLYQVLKSYWERDPQLFLNCLFPLCGHTGPKILQVICFHQRYQLQGFHLVTHSDLEKSLHQLKFTELKSGISSFAIGLKNSSLQIRVKPMNKFTVPGLKVNCSVKYDASFLQVEGFSQEIEKQWRLGLSSPPPI